MGIVDGSLRPPLLPFFSAAQRSLLSRLWGPSPKARGRLADPRGLGLLADIDAAFAPPGFGPAGAEA